MEAPNELAGGIAKAIQSRRQLFSSLAGAAGVALAATTLVAADGTKQRPAIDPNNCGSFSCDTYGCTGYTCPASFSCGTFDCNSPGQFTCNNGY